MPPTARGPGASFVKAGRGHMQQNRYAMPFLVLDSHLEVIAPDPTQHDPERNLAEQTGFSELVEKARTGDPVIAAHVRRMLEQNDFRPQGIEWPDAQGRLHRLMLSGARHSGGPGALFFIQDVTDQSRAIRTLADRVEHGELMLQEMRHRMMNGIQIIASILRIKMRLADSAEVRAHLDDVHRRISSIAALEDHLSPTEGIRSHLIRPYLLAVCESLTASLIDSSRGVDLRVEAAELEMSPDMIVSIGLVVTELVINSLKHGFRDQRGGTISVALIEHGAAWRLRVSDDGLGCQSETFRSAPGLGTRIVRALARRLGAHLEILPNQPSGLQVILTNPGRRLSTRYAAPSSAALRRASSSF